jgi:hypothetical protein
MRGSATFMCRPECHCCLEHAVGPVGVIRDPRNLEIPPPSGQEITTEALKVRSWLEPNAVRPTRVVHALRIYIILLGSWAPPPSHVPAALFEESCCTSRRAPAAKSHTMKAGLESCCISRTTPAAMSHTMKEGAEMCGSATFMCRPEATAALCTRWGP